MIQYLKRNIVAIIVDTIDLCYFVLIFSTKIFQNHKFSI